MSDLDFGHTIPSLKEGQKIFRRYTLRRTLGRGGMGVVWLAHDNELAQDIALKFLPEVIMSDRGALEDLRREARRSRELRHPHIVGIYDFVRDDRMAAISMEYVTGDTLANLRLDRPGQVFGVAELGPLVRALGEALDYAHQEARIVHRDLKPANLMLDARGRLKVADFGIARGITDSVSKLSRPLTGDGSLPYMSPQQMDGHPPAPTDDVYALGASVYELLTGKPPFFRGGLSAVMHQVKSQTAPAMAERRKELGMNGVEVIPPEWEETMAACLAKDSSVRPQSAGEIAVRLGLSERAASVNRVQPVPATRAESAPVAEPPRGEAAERSAAAKIDEPKSADAKRSKRPLWLAVAAAVVVLGGAGYYFGVEAPEQKRRAEATRLAAEAKEKSDREERARQEAERQAKQAAEAKRQAEEVARQAAEAARLAALPKSGQKWTIPELNLELMPIGAGTFVMGSPESEAERGKEEGPQTRVTLTRPFWLGKTEVTQGEWEAVMGSNPARYKGAKLPVETVSWEEAKEYCRKVTERERGAGRLPEGYEYRLPTEAEWEYACRAGTTTAFSYGNSLDASMANFNGRYPYGGAGKGEYRYKTMPVGSFRPNAWGLYDMHGNVWEWCLDWYADALPGGSVSDPVGPTSGSNRVHRGGGWIYYGQRCRSANRYSWEPGYRYDYLGFRLALSSVRGGP